MFVMFVAQNTMQGSEAANGQAHGAPSRVWADVSASPLLIGELMDKVADPGAGAIATFSGVTRNNFQGKEVVKLDYEAYVPMAVKKLREVGEEAVRRWALICIAVAHRVGEVLVGEPSVIIAASSPHRKDALEAVHWAIDELKAVVPIWKKEYFADGSQWKENAESRARLLEEQQQQQQQQPGPGT